MPQVTEEEARKIQARIEAASTVEEGKMHQLSEEEAKAELAKEWPLCIICHTPVVGWSPTKSDFPLHERCRQPAAPLVQRANSHQVGGDHYRKMPGEQHWDRVWRLGLNYFQAMITRYVERYRDKNGVEDLLKARHFLDKLIELEEAANKEKFAKGQVEKEEAVKRMTCDKGGNHNWQLVEQNSNGMIYECTKCFKKEVYE